MKNKKYEKILAVVLMVLMVFWTIGTIFAFDNKFKAKADYVESESIYYGSNITVPVFRPTLYWTSFSSLSTYSMSGMGNSGVIDLQVAIRSDNMVSVSNDFVPCWAWSSGQSYAPTRFFRVDSDYNQFLDFSSASITSGYYTGGVTFNTSATINYATSSNSLSTGNSSFVLRYMHLNNNSVSWFIFSRGTSSSTSATYNFMIGVEESSVGFSPSKIKCVILGNGLQSNVNSSGVGTICLTNAISYVDTDDNFLTLHFPVLFGVVNSTYTFSYWSNFVDTHYKGDTMTFLETRTYYFENYLNEVASSNTESYRLGYNNGFYDGLNEIQPDIATNNYNQGVAVGRSIGYSEGYAEGVRLGGNSSFLGLLGAVVDAPIQALTGLLNFDLLGFNMLTFFYAIMTLCLIIFVIRLMLGGK